jgi:predicted permease
MAALRRFVWRLVNLLRPERAEDDLSRELASHLVLLEDEYRRRGLPAGEARRAARLALGGVEQTKDLHRDARSFVWLDDARRDAGYALRLLRRNPITAVTAVVSLSIGIGANTAIFTVANAVLFRAPAGVVQPDRLVDIGVRRDDGGLGNTSYPTYVDVRGRATTLAGVYAHEMFPHAMSLGVSNRQAAERVFGHFVTTSYFTVLGAVPVAGRLFDAGDGDQPGASPVAVLSDAFWARRFNKDAAVVGQTIRINAQAFTVVGVAPEGFQGSGIMAADVWLPLNMVASADSRESVLSARGGAWLVMGGRVKPGVSIAQAAAELDSIGQALDREYPNPAGARGLRLAPSSRVGGNNRVIGAFFALLMVVVSLVLVVACANVAGILLARAAARRREVAVRLAIGAGRARLVRQLLMEATILFVLGGASGLMLARAMTSLAIPLLPSLPFPISVTLALDGRVIAFTTGLSLAAALLSGLVPALQASKADVMTALKDEAEGSPRASRLRSAFVVAQVAFSLLLVVAAGLFVRALERAGSMNPGFDPHGVELASVDLAMGGYTGSTGPRFARDLLDRVRQLPSVETATIARVFPGGFEGIGLGGVMVPGVPLPTGEPFLYPAWNIVEPGYFATLRIPLAAGRDFSATDVDGAQPVAIIGEGLARQFWPGQAAIGKFISQQLFGPRGPNGTRSLLVVGVARDVKSSSLIDGLAAPFVYVPLQQHEPYGERMVANLTIAARTTHGQRIAEEIRTLVVSMNPNLPIVTSQTLDDATALGLVPQRIAASVSGSLGIVGLLLAAIGIYGVTAYAVARRTHEFGIRIALGARRADIVRMVLWHGMMLTAIGCAIGLSLGAAAAQVLAVFLFGLPPLDPVTFGGATVLFAAIGLAACYGPARRATNVDPLVALRHE